MERNDQIDKITKLLEFLEGQTKADALRMLDEASDYVTGRDDLFPWEIKSKEVKDEKQTSL